MTDPNFIANLIKSNQARWEKVNISPNRRKEVMDAALRICSQKKRYQEIEKSTGVPWYVVGIIHWREASGDFSKNIAQGDRWDRISVHVPKGRGPFTSWEAAALDALKACPPYAARWHDWSPGGTLTLLEEYNGLGYELYHHEASPYLWGATDMEEKGKYIADGVYDKNVWDTQIGSAALLKAMMTIDPSILSISGSEVLGKGVDPKDPVPPQGKQADVAGGVLPSPKTEQKKTPEQAPTGLIKDIEQFIKKMI